MFQLKQGELVKTKVERDHDIELHRNVATDDTRQRINLNDLLQRAKDKKKADNKFNLLVISGALSLTLLVIVILNL